MTKEWFQKLGFRKNPLNVEPRFKEKLFGSEVLLDEIFYRIESGNIIFLEGILGKTAILLKIIEKYQGIGRVAYVNCEKVKDEPDIKKLLSNGEKSLRMIAGLPKDMIILLDNISVLSRKNAQKIKFYFDQGNILSLVMTGNNYSKTSLPMSIKHRIGKRVYKLKELTKDEAVDLVMERINFNESLKEENIYKIAERSSDLKELLQNCEVALRLMINESLVEVNDRVIEMVFKENAEEQQETELD